MRGAPDRPAPRPVGESLGQAPLIFGKVREELPASLPPAFPAVYPEFPESDRPESQIIMTNLDARWGMSRGQAIWDGMPLTFYEPRLAYQSYDVGWNPIVMYPAPSITQPSPSPLQYALRGT